MSSIESGRNISVEVSYFSKIDQLPTKTIVLRRRLAIEAEGKIDKEEGE